MATRLQGGLFLKFEGLWLSNDLTINKKRTSSIYGALGIFVVMACLAATGYFSQCVLLYRNRDSECEKYNPAMCNVCTTCVCNSNCTRHELRILWC